MFFWPQSCFGVCFLTQRADSVTNLTTVCVTFLHVTASDSLIVSHMHSGKKTQCTRLIHLNGGRGWGCERDEFTLGCGVTPTTVLEQSECND